MNPPESRNGALSPDTRVLTSPMNFPESIPRHPRGGGDHVDMLGRSSGMPRSTSPSGGGRGGLSLQSTLRVLKRRRWIVAVCLIALPIAAYLYSHHQTKQYTASASLLFRDPGFDQKLLGSTLFPEGNDPARTAATNQKLVSLGVVALNTARKLGGGLRQADVQGAIDVSEEGNSDLVSVSATSDRPALAASLANTFTQQYIEFRRNADRSKILDAQKQVEQRLAQMTPAEQASTQGQELKKNAEQLAVMASLQTGNAELVQPAERPTSPSSPKTKRNVILGILLGGILGIGLAFLAEQLDRRIKEPEEVEDIFGLPILATIPESRMLSNPDRELQMLPSVEAEAFRMLRTNLRYFNVDREIRSVIVTSSSPQDGKSTVSWNLAAAAARSGSKVLFIEADLRRPSLAHTHTLPTDNGLSLLLAGAVDIGDATFSAPVSQSATALGLPTLDVIAAGPIPPNPAELIESPRMQELIHRAEEEYDLVVIDTPPVSMVADAVPLMTAASGVVVVTRLRRTRRDVAAKVSEQLRNLGAPVLGVVLNGGAAREGYYGYEPEVRQTARARA
jgi:capsular exopolysaccharide synthesis family protein